MAWGWGPWGCVWPLVLLLVGSPVLAGHSGPSPVIEGSVRAFGPRMDYDEWTPLGRGDPLKNDPTYDYVPPVLERVHYWMEPAKAKEANSRRDHVDPFLKFVDVSGPKGYIPRIANYRGNSLPDVPPTMLVPPPYNPPVPMTSTTPMAATSNLDVEAVNMVHHSSTTLGWMDGKTQLATLAPAAYSSLNPFHHFEDSPVVPNTFEDKPVSFEDPATNMNYEDKLPAGTNKVHYEDKPVASNIIGGFGSSQETPVKTAPVRYPPEAENAILAYHKPSNLSEVVIKPPSPSMVAPPQRPPPPPARPPPREQEVVILDSDGKPAPQDETLASLIKSLLQGEVLPSPQEPAMVAISPMPPKMPMPPAPPMPPKLNMPPRPPMPPSSAPTTVPTLTTDPLFSHYKQPATPVSGPPYLIIQGHSKVKTYGASKQSKHGVHGVHAHAHGNHGIPVHSHNDIRGDAA